MEEGNLAILVDAKIEYTKQLVNIISPNIFKGIKIIYNNSKTNSFNNDTLLHFQNDLSQIPKWNQEVINEHYNSLVQISDCDWLEDLLTAVFVSHTRILTSINFSKNKNKINLKIPKVDHFIHLCYIEVARIFWKNPYLFDDTISKFEYQRNRRDAEKIIDNTINETIRKQLPVKHILKEYLGNEFKEANTDFTVSENNNEHENLRKMVKAEIENCSKEKLEKLNINSLDLESKESVNINEDRIKNIESLENNNDILNSVSFVENNYESNEPETDIVKDEIDLVKTDIVKTDIVKDEIDLVKTDIVKDEIDLVKTDIVKDEIDLVKTESENENSKEEIGLLESNQNNNLEEQLVTDHKIQVDKSTELKKDIISQSDNEMSELELETVKIDELNNTLSDIEIDVENTINNEIDNLKIETLNLNIDDDLSNLDEIYIDTPNNKLENLDDNKIKTVYIETSEKPKKKNSFNDTDIEIDYDDENNYKIKKYSKQDFNFFN